MPPLGRRRSTLRSVLLAVALVAVGCDGGGDGDDDDVRPEAGGTTTTSEAGGSSSSSTSSVASAVGACTPSFAAVPAAGEVTWLTTSGELRSPAGCLAKLDSSPSTIEWNGTGSQALVDDELIVDGAGAVPTKVTGSVTWSRPTGKSLLAVRDGRLFKRPLDGEAREVSFLGSTDVAIYHPAGRSIVAGGGDTDFRPGLFIADNEGRNRKPLASAEDSAVITDAAFTASGALLFVAEHQSIGDDEGVGETHIHRLEFDPSELTTIETFPRMGMKIDLVTSPFAGGGVAYSRADRCGAPMKLWASRDGKVLPTGGTAIDGATPVGWTSDGTLFAVAGVPSCSDEPGELLAYKDGVATAVASGVVGAAVRAVLPPPPDPPVDLPDEAPA